MGTVDQGVERVGYKKPEVVSIRRIRRDTISDLILKDQSILKKPRVLQQSQLLGVVFCLVNIPACFTEAVEDIIKYGMRSRVITRRCESTKIFEKQLIASDSLDWLSKISVKWNTCSAFQMPTNLDEEVLDAECFSPVSLSAFDGVERSR